MGMLCTTAHGSVSANPNPETACHVLTISLVKGLADGEVQVLKSKALEAQGPDAAA